MGRRVQLWAEDVKKLRNEIRLTSVTVASRGRVPYIAWLCMGGTVGCTHGGHWVGRKARGQSSLPL